MKRPRLTGMDILSHLGMIGNPLSTNSLVPRAETPASIQRQYQEFFDAGNVANPDVWSKYAQAMKRPSTMETMLQLWDDMASWDIIAAALVQIVDEVCQTDNSQPNAIWYECNNSKAEEELNDMLQRIDAENLITSQVWHVTALGNHFEKLDYSPGEGVRGFTFVHPFEMRRYWLERNRQCIGYRWKGHTPNKDDVFVAPDNKTPIERVALSHGNNLEDLYYPWDFMHLRRMFRLRSSEHGEPLFDEAQGLYKKLRLAIDQMVVHRAQIQPDRYVVNIDTQDLPPTEQLKAIQRWKQSMRNKMSFGSGSGTDTFGDPTDFRSFYNPLALDTIFYMARPKGMEHSIQKLQGTTQVPDVFDIELLIDLLFSVLGMPKSWFGIGASDGAAPPSGKSLLAQDIRFLRKVKSIRKPIVNGYTWLAYFHMLLKGENIGHLNIRAKMPDIGGLEDQMKMELLKGQAEVLSMLGDVMQTYALPKEAWVELIFKKYLHLPDDVVDVFITSLPAEIPTPGMESARSVPREGVLLNEIQQRLIANPEVVGRLKETSRKFYSVGNERITTDWKNQQALIRNMPVIKDGDIAKVHVTEAGVTLRIKDGKSQIVESANLDAPNGRPPVGPSIPPPVQSDSTFQPNWRRYVKA
jgi:hypothetical protein